MTDPKKILVVDDDPTARVLMRAALRKTGFDVLLADNGENALRLFDQNHCDMVMLDVDMPGLRGPEVCAALRARAGDLLPVVMVTGMDDVLSVEQAFDSGATDFIRKPINWALIGHRIRYLFRNHQALLDLRAAEARNAAVLEAIPDLLFEMDLDGRYITSHSPRGAVLASPAQDYPGLLVADVLPPEASQEVMVALRSAHETGFSNGHQYALPQPRGPVWFELSVSRKRVDEGQEPRFIVLAREITERKQAELRIMRLAYFDSLTGLPNRQSFLERTQREIERARQGHTRLGVLFMDLDHFKDINDSLGHSVGDLILQGASDRLRRGLRPSDAVARAAASDGHVELARLGGDEFTALIPDITHPEDALVVAERITQLMRQPFLLDGRQVRLTVSMGIAIYPDDGADAETMLKHSDTAMYHAKRSGRDNTQFYSASLTEQVLRRMELDASLRGGLERSEFHLLYQPQVDVASGQIHSVEALIRWTPPGRAPVPPIEFIPFAEQNGLIEGIGLWVLQTACADAARWERDGHHVRVAVNLSPLQIRDPGLLQSVSAALADSGLSPELLELEVTEGALLEDSDVSISTFRGLRELGVALALDDFGTGYSSLSYLTRLPIGKLKIDRCFIQGLLAGGENAAIVRAVLAMAASLGMEVTAEGVETLAQAQLLKIMDCDKLQGFYFSHAVPAQDIPALLARHWALDADPPGS